MKNWEKIAVGAGIIAILYFVMKDKDKDDSLIPAEEKGRVHRLVGIQEEIAVWVLVGSVIREIGPVLVGGDHLLHVLDVAPDHLFVKFPWDLEELVSVIEFRDVLHVIAEMLLVFRDRELGTPVSSTWARTP